MKVDQVHVLLSPEIKINLAVDDSIASIHVRLSCYGTEECCLAFFVLTKRSTMAFPPLLTPGHPPEPRKHSHIALPCFSVSAIDLRLWPMRKYTNIHAYTHSQSNHELLEHYGYSLFHYFLAHKY